MKLSISNIAWDAKHDDHMYEYLSQNNIHGLEIAPTRIFPSTPYNHTDHALEYKQYLSNWDIKVSSMQSIWYGITENIFDGTKQRQALIDYTKMAIDFAKILECKNLVFGCPKNRNITNLDNIGEEEKFFIAIAEYANSHSTTIALEPNPTIYNTNFINTTSDAFDYVKKLNCKGFMVNVDFGTIIHNEENLSTIEENIHLVNHIHISEPFLAIIKKRQQHKDLASILKNKGYDKYISVEMKNTGELADVKNTLDYVQGVFAYDV